MKKIYDENIWCSTLGRCLVSLHMTWVYIFTKLYAVMLHQRFLWSWLIQIMANHRFATSWPFPGNFTYWTTNKFDLNANFYKETVIEISSHQRFMKNGRGIMNDQVFCIRQQQDCGVYINEEPLHAPDCVTVFIQLPGIKTIQQKSRWWLPRVILLRNGVMLYTRHNVTELGSTGPLWHFYTMTRNDNS